MEFFTIRRAAAKDAGDIARVRITGWRQSYRGIVPDVLLEKLDIDKDRQRVELMLSDPANKSLRFVVELDGKIVGMGSCGAARKSADEKRGEIYSIYLLDEAKRQGIGRNFMREMAQVLAANGFTSLQLNVLENNLSSRRFYEALGGRQSGSGVFEYEGFQLPDVTYVWDDIKMLSSTA